jgi:polyhydroxyalkanoate synthesis regulator phasin
MSTELISKAILSGIGFANLTKEAIHKTAEDLVNQSKLSEQEGRKVVKEFQRRSEQVQRTLEKKVTSAVHKALQGFDPTALNGRAKDTKSTARRTAKRARRKGTQPRASR